MRVHDAFVMGFPFPLGVAGSGDCPEAVDCATLVVTHGLSWSVSFSICSKVWFEEGRQRNSLNSRGPCLHWCIPYEAIPGSEFFGTIPLTSSAITHFLVTFVAFSTSARLPLLAVEFSSAAAPIVTGQDLKF